jgi:type IV fimbrial biogenesis protein FimT
MGPGFTLVELMVTVARAAILMATAVPAYDGFITNQRVKTASYELYISLLHARSDALKRNRDVFITPNGTWANGWIVATSSTRTDSDAAAVKCRPTASRYRLTWQP